MSNYKYIVSHQDELFKYYFRTYKEARERLDSLIAEGTEDVLLETIPYKQKKELSGPEYAAGSQKRSNSKPFSFSILTPVSLLFEKTPCVRPH